MFEKEAKEDYLSNLRGKVENNNESRLEEQFEETFQRGAICGYNKANEWHYPSKGEYPKDDSDILCQISKDEVVVGYYHIEQKRYITIDGQDLYNVIAWKEIVLPKESE